MLSTKSFAAHAATSPLVPFEFKRRELKPTDIQIKILYCGICHSDIHQVRNEWKGTTYPIVPGHEIVGEIIAVGNLVTDFKVGEIAGVGCLVVSCRTCPDCISGEEQYCDNGSVGTYNAKDKDGNITLGGYSNQIVVDKDFVLHIKSKNNLAAIAPLLCAGITTYSPLKHVGVKKGHKVAVLGLGGLGHMAVKFAVAFGAEVTMLSSSKNKEEDAKKLGAHHFILTSNEKDIQSVQNHFDFILNTVSAPHNYNTYLQLLKTNGTMIIVGAPTEPMSVPAFNLVMKRRSIIGSLIGGLKQTQEMLDFCADNNIVSDIELIPIQQVNEAYERILKNDVKYRFVIDMKSLD
ncbi:MAG: NAD(P)-dependent alcohol dehydrogenase [Sediminibacterium sp.]|nr:NAD(P)-dependent alcohol dehydrogenase [Sediminibacterium sp.]